MQKCTKHFPYHGQTIMGSCGPACVVMAIKYLRPHLDVPRLFELTSWSRIWLFPFGATDEYGLSYLLASKDLNVEVFSRKPGIRFYPKSRLAHYFVSSFGEFMQYSYDLHRRIALSTGVKEKFQEVDSRLILELLESGCVPIAMVDQSSYAPDDAFPDGILHWVIVTKHNGVFHIHDPDIGPITLSREELERGMDLHRNFGINSRIVSVC